MPVANFWSDKITQRFDGRFTFFYCQEFFPLSQAQTLLKRFPLHDLEALRKADVTHSTISKYRHPQLFEEIIARDECWKTVYSDVCSPEFVSETLSSFGDAICRRYPIIFRVFAKKWILNPKRYYSEMQFSIRWTGSVLSPHTDNADKVLALVIYLPEEGQESTIGGTTFYLPRSWRSELRVFQRYLKFGWLATLGLRRLRSSKLPTSDSFAAEQLVQSDLRFFDANYSRAFEAPYKLGGAGGFIKNQFSWHDVRLTRLADWAPRRSVLVNLMLRPSKVRSLTNTLLSGRDSSQH